MRYLIMQGIFPKMESLPARSTYQEADEEVRRLNMTLERPKDVWNGSSCETYWIKEIE